MDDQDAHIEKMMLGIQLAMGTVKVAKRCDCDWPPTVPEIPHRPWCASLTGSHMDLPDGW